MSPGARDAILALVLVLALVLAQCGSAGTVVAADQPLTTALSLGYDSNPAQRQDGPELGFAQVAMGLRYALLQGWSLGGDLWLRDAAGANDSGRLDWDVAWLGRLGRSQLNVWGTGGWYRDQLVPADERNETALGVLLTRALTARLDTSLLGERRWFAYRHRVLPWVGRPSGLSPKKGSAGMPGPHGPGAGGPGNQGDSFSARRRADRLDALALDTTWLVSARLSLTVGLDQGWRHSSIPLDAYHQTGARLILSFDPSDRFSLSAEVGSARLDYQHAPRQLERLDRPRWLGLELWHWRDPGAWFCGLEWLDSRSTLDAEAFTQWVGHCGYQHDF
ncbi:hypothetical protein [Rhabdochromatium marinum]|uniref:hypothetical protein n=1 Tax=Rhabdochromatium marinum TaxID=48729 RepID=UPI00190380F0|nr:hypothetical protein [Rhabdochromatium marinum]MBK1649180.1 hypothetical protein [Rhabdochromatium marinum]